MRVHLLALVVLCAWSAAGCVSGPSSSDFDGDGVTDAEDCAPADAAVHAGAPDPFDDGLDTNCDGVDGVDADGDAFPIGDGVPPAIADCNDADPRVHPGAAELLYDRTDNDCDGAIDEDSPWTDDDGDGACEDADNPETLELEEVCGDGATGGDCDDDDATVHPFDEDGDGWSSCAGDCNDDPDNDGAAQSPLAIELCNGRDDDCDGATVEESDADGDGFLVCAGDCGDGDATVHVGAPELCDALDNDCDGTVDETFDADGDGVTGCGPDGVSGTSDDDCDEGDPAIHPLAVEVCDFLDNDCDGGANDLDPTDADGDGDPACADCDDSAATGASVSTLDADGDLVSSCAGDCDDSDPADFPGAEDFVGNSDDDNCDGVDGVDGDGDGAASAASGGLDCDDADPLLNLMDVDGDGSTTCAGDCDDADASLDALDADGDGFTTCAGDCVDSAPTVWPGAAEVCDAFDTDCDPSTNLPPVTEDDGGADGVDTDSDGFADCADCDDDVAVSYPGALELCDGFDNDCDGVVLANGPGGEADHDGDLYVECAPLGALAPGTWLGGGDCNDFVPSVHPGALELCDGVDNDCDGGLDEDGDQDGDGICGGDCNDDPTDPIAASVYPGQWDPPSDGVDWDCDGLDGTGLAEVAGWTFVGDPGWQVGRAVTGVGDLDGDGLDDLAFAETAADTTGGTSSGTVFVVLGSELAGNAGFPISQAARQIAGAPGDRIARAAAGPGDITGDGIPDLLLGEYSANSTSGRVYIVSGADLTTPGTSSITALAWATIDGLTSTWFGYRVSGAGDLDGDGRADVLVSARNAGGGGITQAGFTYLFLSGSMGAGGAFTASDADATFRGTTNNDRAGAGLLGGCDLDLDGYPDIVVGVPFDDTVDADAGMVHVFSGADAALGGAWTTAQSWVQISQAGSDRNAYLADSFACVPDLDGDQLPELAIGHDDEDIPGEVLTHVYLFAGTQIAPGGALDLADAFASLAGASVGDDLGAAVVAPGDVDGDGLGDLFIGARLDGAAAQGGGAGYLFLGSTLAAGGALSVASDADQAVTLGVGGAQGCGTLSGPGDVDGDGLDDLGCGAIGWGSGTGEGAFFLLPAP